MCISLRVYMCMPFYGPCCRNLWGLGFKAYVGSTLVLKFGICGLGFGFVGRKMWPWPSGSRPLKSKTLQPSRRPEDLVRMPHDHPKSCSF